MVGIAPNLQASLFELTMSFSDAMDLVSPEVVDHHKKVAYIAGELGREYGLDVDKTKDLVIAGLLHDSGALSLRERLDALSFEAKAPHRHAEMGYRLFKNFKPLKQVAKAIRYHHVAWNRQEEIKKQTGEEVPIESHIIHLADRISVLVNRDKTMLNGYDRQKITARVVKEKGELFSPELVEVFQQIAEREYFWLDITYPGLGERLLAKNYQSKIDLTITELVELAEVFRHLIDFKSSFTATHSSGVAATAKELAAKTGFSQLECDLMDIAGSLHDLGKLAVPNKILDKPEKLTEEEYDIIKNHTYYTYRSLERIPQLDLVNQWASLHHERLDGKGYPFKYSEYNLPLGSKIMAVADVFTAITENRPYRKKMPDEKVKRILTEMGDTKKMDKYIIDVLIQNFEHFNYLRDSAQQISQQRFKAYNEHAENASEI
ncbi:HD-GYP domain-containing protein [Natranaerobius thermophilus]|uniref:Metal dependent phosphohydrolase n=1 Tax=Natranaerobius thermophilus (strain ATCC BAA-1301 / DSM 18059 / JW/NM-WN-LF) TaxID=457570 RepID=B2A4X3_NATTJ|nr:HD domain-containing phosphohydrolase [Natranaerobius thermophilus]ACB83895.1 metal dependent phosphohydrolase [Natranaerobius thermophilus JW/NM-WN-LF]